MSGAHGAGLVLDSNMGLLGSKCFTLYVCTVSGSRSPVRHWPGVGQVSHGCLVCLYRRESR